MNEDQKRERGVIESVFSGREPDHDVITCSLHIDFGGGCQGFGNLILNDRLLPLFVSALCETFGVATFEDLKGKECFALRCWGFHSDCIEGVESVDTGKRFTIHGWRTSVGVKGVNSPLESRKQYLLNDLASHERRAQEILHTLHTLDEDYTDWSRT